MAETFDIPPGLAREERYKLLLPQLEALLQGEDDLTANLANTAAALKTGMGFFWIGFYLVKGTDLVLGPFQGPVACTRIRKGLGVCGKAWEEKQVIIVPDVDKFPGHIACSNDSKSEIVLPMLINNEVVLVLDVDSDSLNDFSKVDQHYLEQVIHILKQRVR